MSKNIYFNIRMVLVLVFVINCLFFIKFSSELQIVSDNALVINSNKMLRNRTTKKPDINSDSSFIFGNRLINGSLEELKLVPKKFILQSLEELEDVALNLDRKLIIWDILKDKKSCQMLTLTEIKQIGSLIKFIPETDLFNLNVSDWKIVEYLGTYPHLHRRQTGIIGYAIKQQWGDSVMMDVEIIKKMKGLICGFSITDLKLIPNEVFFQLDRQVFRHIKSCTRKQLKVMVTKAKKTLVHGPPQSWKIGTCQNLSRLIKSLSLKDLETIQPIAMAGIDSETIEEMTLEQLLVFSEEQVNHMCTPALSTYRKITGIISSNSKNLVCQTLSSLIVYKISLHILK